jgi:serine/threonine-protein kinase RsbW
LNLFVKALILMSKLTKPVVTLYIPSDLGYEKIPIAAVAIMAHKMGFDPERVENLKTATGEAVTNAIEHGNLEKPGTEVIVKFISQPQKLTIFVIDQGLSAIPHISTERGERPDDRGWGFEWIREFMDEATTTASPGRNEIKMVAYLTRKT